MATTQSAHREGLRNPGAPGSLPPTARPSRRLRSRRSGGRGFGEAARIARVRSTGHHACGNLITGRPDLPDAIRRLEAFAAAGADVLYAPGLTTRDAINSVVRAVAPKRVNVAMGLSGATFSLAALGELGVKRVSPGSSLARAAFGALLHASREVRDFGTFAFSRDAMPYAELNCLFERKGKD